MTTANSVALSSHESVGQDIDARPEGERYMRIGEVAEELGVTLRALRFYEDKGLVAPKRVGTTRLYGRRDFSRLKLIMLGRRVGFSLREVKQMMDLYDPEGSNYRQMKVAMEKGTRQLARLEKQREEIEGAIGELQQALGHVRGSLEKSGC